MPRPDPAADRRTCRRCGKTKPLAAYRGPRGATCTVCLRLRRSEYHQRPEVQARDRERKHTPEALARSREWSNAYHHRHPEIVRERNRTLKHRLITHRATYRVRLRQATDPERIGRLFDRIASINAEMQRLGMWGDDQPRPMSDRSIR